MSFRILKQARSSFLLLMVTVLLPISVSSISLFFLSTYESKILEFSFWQWILFYVITAFTMALALTPTTYIAIISGYFAGWMSLCGLVPSYVIASLIGFYLAGKLDKGNLLNYFSEQTKIKAVIDNLKTEEFGVIFFCRISPALPFAMMNVFLSFMNVKIKNFISASILGMLPRTILSVWMGTQASDIIKMLKGSEEPKSSNLLIMALLIFSVVGLYFFFIRALNRVNRNSEQ